MKNWERVQKAKCPETNDRLFRRPFCFSVGVAGPLPFRARSTSKDTMLGHSSSDPGGKDPIHGQRATAFCLSQCRSVELFFGSLSLFCLEYRKI